MADFYKNNKNHIITCVTEHKCVLESCRQLSNNGFDVTYLPVNQDGLIDLKKLEDSITDKTFVGFNNGSSQRNWCDTTFKRNWSNL